MLHLSFSIKKERFSIIHPKWWQFWKKAKLKTSTYWDRKTVRLPFSEKECLRVCNSGVFEHVLIKLYGNFWGLQLTEENIETSYLKTNGLVVEPQQTNFIKDSGKND